MCLLVLTRLCCTIGIVDFVWASGGRSKFLGEWASLRNRIVLLLVCSGPSLPAQLPVYYMHTSGSSGHTPAADVIE